MAIVTFHDRTPRDLASFIEEARRLLDRGDPIEAVWRSLRVDGCSISESIRVTMALTGMSHDDAKSAVYRGDAWGSWRPAIDRLHDACERAVVEMGGDVREVDEGQPSIPSEKDLRLVRRR